MPTSSERIRLVLEIANPSVRANLAKDINVKMKVTLDKSSGGGFSTLQKWQESGLNLKVNLQLGGTGFNQIQKWISEGIVIKTRFENSGGSYQASRAGINPKPKTGSPKDLDVHPENARRQDLISRASAAGINYRGRTTDQLESDISAKEQQNAQKSLDRAAKTFEIYRQIAKKQQEIFEQQQKVEAIRKRSASNSKAFSDSFFSELGVQDQSNVRPIRTIPSFTNRGSGPSVNTAASKQFDQAIGNEFKNFFGSTLKAVNEGVRGTVKEFTLGKGKPAVSGDKFISEFLNTLKSELGSSRASGVKTVNSLTTPRPDYEKGSNEFNRSFIDEFRRPSKGSKGPKTITEAFGQGISPEDLEERQRQDTQFERNASIRRRPPGISDAQSFRNQQRLKRATERALLSPVFSNFDEEIEKSAFDFGVSPGDLRKSIGSQKRSLIDPRRLGAKGVAREATFAFLFGGLPGLGGALAGASVSPEGGSFVGATLAQKAADTIGEVFHKVADALGEAAQAGLEFERSILTISSVLQKNSTVVTPNGAPADIKDVVQFQDQRARAIQRKARPALAKIGIAGSAEATLLRGLLTGAASRGFDFDPDQLAQLAGLLGGATSLFAPELKDNPSLFAKNIEEFVQGKSNASRTVLGSAIPSVLQEAKRASSPEEFLKAAQKLEPLLDVLKNSDNVAASLTRLNASFDILKTTVGDEFLKSLAPGIKQLSDVLSKSKVGDSLVSLAKIIGAFASDIVKIAAFLLEKFGAKTVAVPGGAALGAGAGAALGFGAGSFFGGPLFGGLLGGLAGGLLGGVAGGFGGNALGDLANNQSAAVRAQLDADNALKNPKGLKPVPTPESVIQGILAPIGLGEGSFDQASDTRLQSNPFYKLKTIDKALDKIKENSSPELKDKFLPDLLTERLDQLKKLQDTLENNFDDFTFAGQREKLLFRRGALGSQESDSHALVSSLQKKLTSVGPETDEGVKVSSQLDQAQQDLADILKKEAQVGHDLVDVDQARIHVERSLRDAIEDVRHAKVEEALETRKLTRDLAEAQTAVKEFAAQEEDQIRGKEQELLGAAKEVKDLGGSVPNTLDAILSDPELEKSYKLKAAEAKLNQLLETVGLPGTESQSGASHLFGSTGGSFQEKLQHEKESLEDNVKGINEQLRKLIEALRSAVEKLNDLFATDFLKLKAPDRFGEYPKYPRGKGKDVENSEGKPRQTGGRTFELGATGQGSSSGNGYTSGGQPGSDQPTYGGGVSDSSGQGSTFGPPGSGTYAPNNPFRLKTTDDIFPSGNSEVPEGLTYGNKYRDLFGMSDNDIYKYGTDYNSMLSFGAKEPNGIFQMQANEARLAGQYNAFRTKSHEVGADLHGAWNATKESKPFFKNADYKALENFMDTTPYTDHQSTWISQRPGVDEGGTVIASGTIGGGGSSSADIDLEKLMPWINSGELIAPEEPSALQLPNGLVGPGSGPRMFRDHAFDEPLKVPSANGSYIPRGVSSQSDFDNMTPEERQNYLDSGEIPGVKAPDSGSWTWDGAGIDKQPSEPLTPYSANKDWLGVNAGGYTFSDGSNRPAYLDMQPGSWSISAPGDYAEDERYDLQEGKGVNAVRPGMLDDPHYWDKTPLEQWLDYKRQGFGGMLEPARDPNIVDWMPDHPDSLDHSFGAPPEPSRQEFDNSIKPDDLGLLPFTQSLLDVPVAPVDVHVTKSSRSGVPNSFFGGYGPTDAQNLAHAANLFDIFGNSSPGKVDDLLGSSDRFDLSAANTFMPELQKNQQVNNQNTSQYNSTENSSGGQQIQQLMQQLVDILKGQSQQSATALKGAIESAFGG